MEESYLKGVVGILLIGPGLRKFSQFREVDLYSEDPCSRHRERRHYVVVLTCSSERGPIEWEGKEEWGDS